MPQPSLLGVFIDPLNRLKIGKPGRYVIMQEAKFHMVNPPPYSSLYAPGSKLFAQLTNA